jgi:hypothetical protein
MPTDMPTDMPDDVPARAGIGASTKVGRLLLRDGLT